MTNDLVKRLRNPTYYTHPTTEDGRLAADRIEQLTAERDRLAHVIDNRESHYGISSNGGMWRFWADEARKIADENKALTAERDRLREALTEAWDAHNKHGDQMSGWWVHDDALKGETP